MFGFFKKNGRETLPAIVKGLMRARYQELVADDVVRIEHRDHSRFDRSKMTHAQRLQYEGLLELREQLVSSKRTQPSPSGGASSTNTLIDPNNPGFDEIAFVDKAIEDVRLYMRAATPAEYADFLVQHFARGGHYTHNYDYPIQDNILIAERDMHLPRGYGAASLSIIIPSGILVTEPGGRDSHNNLYYMDEPSQNQNQRHFGYWVPLYTDVVNVLRKRGVNPHDFSKTLTASARPLNVPFTGPAILGAPKRDS